METNNPPPFSARHGESLNRIDRDFPASARTGLSHLLHDLVEKQYVRGWDCLAKELLRINREPPVIFNSSSVTDIERAKRIANDVLFNLPWVKVYDFCERLHNYLASEVGVEGQYGWETEIPKAEVQAYIAEELQRLFLEEGLVFEFSEGAIRRQGRKHTAEMAAKAHLVLGDPLLLGSRKHYEKALSFFRSPAHPDYENCVKEAVCAVEAAAKALFPESKQNTLGGFVTWLNSSKHIEVPKTLSATISAIYGFRNGGDGIAHGGGTGGSATKDVAEYILSISAAQIIYLTDLVNQRDGDVPF